MTPEMWLDLGPSHTVLDTAFPQIADSLGDSARCCLATALAFTFYPGKCMPSPLWSWYHGWVGRGAKIFQASASSKGAAYAASGAQGITPEPLGVVPHARAGWWRFCSLLLQAQCRQPFEAAVGQHSVAG